MEETFKELILSVCFTLMSIDELSLSMHGQLLANDILKALLVVWWPASVSAVVIH